MAKYSDVMRWVAELDNRDVLKGFKEIEDQGKKSLDEVGDESEGLSDRFKGAGGKMGKALVAGFAAVGVGAILLNEIDKAFSRQDSLNVVTGRFALTADEAKKYGKIAGDLYAEGWGAGIEEVQQAVAVTFERLEVDSEETGKELSRHALAVSKTWGTDVDSVIRSIGQLMQNDLVDSSQEAMDLVVAAFQEGGDEAGDLLDTIDEYSQHWAALGLSGEDALNQIIHGFQNGQRDADKMADAVKEMGIRIREDTEPVREALENIGLDADDVVDAFLEGGPRARDAFLDVVNALAEGQAQGADTEDAVALIGTQFEDLGPTALESLAAVDGALENTQGRAENLAATVEGTPWDRLQRQGETALGKLGDSLASQINGPLDTASRMFDDWFGGGSTPTSSAAVTAALESVKDNLDQVTASTIEAARETGNLDDEFGDAEAGAGEFWSQVGDVVESHYDAAAAAEEHKRRLDDLVTSVHEAISSAFDYERANIDMARAAGDFADQQIETTEILNDSESSARDKETALYDLRDAELDAAEQAWETAKAFAEEHAQSGTAAEKAGLQRDKLEELAAQFPFLRDEIQQYIDKLNQIPTSRTTTVTTAFVSTGQKQPRPGMNAVRAAGGPTQEGGLYRVGERGKPELYEENGQHFLIPGDRGRVTPADKGGGSMGGDGIVVNVDARGAVGLNGPQLERLLVETLRKHVRFNGSISGVTG